jgi:hypothetical protein
MSQANVQSLRLHCSDCNSIWSENLLINVTIDVWAAHVRSLRCPGCAGKKLNLVCDEDKLRAGIGGTVQLRADRSMHRARRHQ